MIRRIVITGSPGSGKTSIIDELKKLDINCIDECAREIIIEERKKNSQYSPLGDQKEFDKKVLNKRIELFQAANEGMNLFDRGIIDGMAYSLIIKKKIPHEFIAAAKKYNYDKMVFFLPSWKKIYKKDGQRWHNYHEARRLGNYYKSLYRKYGYNVVTIPKTTVKKRIEFIKSKIGTI